MYVLAFEFQTQTHAQIKMAVEAGFEPAVPVSQYVSLANWWFQPLTHSTYFISGILERFPLSFKAVAKVYNLSIKIKIVSVLI